MNPIKRGVKNALRSPVRTGAIILMLAVSVTLIVSMLVAHASITSKIDEVKENSGTAITITPAGVQGFMGGGDPLTSEQVTTIEDTSNITSTVATLSDQLGEDDTSLESALELGSFGERQQRFESSEDVSAMTPPEGSDDTAAMPAGGGGMGGPRTTVTGTTALDDSYEITSGEAIDGDSSAYEAVLGSTLAEKNDLSVGDTFTLYDETFTVVGIFSTDNQFQDSGLSIPLATLQALTEQKGAVTEVLATVNSSDNVTSVVESLKSSLGDDADITSQAEQAEQSVESLQSISSLALTGVIGAAGAAAAIILLAMTMIVRERRREIGVIKAIGGTNRSVITQFMSEALTLTVIGGVVGLALGIAVSGPMTNSLVSNQSSSSSQQSSERGGPGERRGGFEGGRQQVAQTIESISSTVTPSVLAAGIGITLLIAILGSALPAWIIANIKPAEVLRSE